MKKIFIAIGMVVTIFVVGILIKLNKENKILDSGIFGQVLLGPTCPAVQEGDNSCKDKPYRTTINIAFQRTGGDKAFLYETIETDEQGKYKIMLPPRADGRYHIRALGGQPYPRCGNQTINVDQDAMLEVDILCDTGIRLPEMPLN
ncbi:hypothetical protein N8083_00365 [Candidatus Pacebacteria bacterium]|nr:hypothetical protein [Candidatus Paceibacterota bacterium]